ncbi:MAG: hypothetical protein ACKVJ4_06655 [Flavobacteriales bacterium]|jgi:hypothetical protein|tara:strand:- start:8853 stop:9128 length:276 start_codon:yes stop_codon:yes gene_type:complete
MMLKIIEILFGIVFSCIGVINLFWGNDPVYGFSIILISLLYYPPFNSFIEYKIKRNYLNWIKLIIGVLIFWTSLGVADLFDKINLMINYLS